MKTTPTTGGNYYVWFTTYGTYADPDVPPKLISGPMTFEKAQVQVQKLGFGYCIKEIPT